MGDSWQVVGKGTDRQKVKIAGFIHYSEVVLDDGDDVEDLGTFRDVEEGHRGYLF